MQGTGTLTAYAGQVATLSGEGAFYAYPSGGQSLLQGEGTLSATGSVPASATLSGLGELFAVGSIVSHGYAMLPALEGIGGNTSYAISSTQYVAAVTSDGDNFYVPPAATIGYAMLPAVTSWGLGEGTPGTATATLPALMGVGGNTPYAFASATLPATVSFGIFQANDVMTMFSIGEASSETELILDSVLVFSSTGSLISSFSVARIALFDVLSTLTASGVLTISAELSMDIIDALTASSVSMAQIGTAPDLDTTSRVWTINLDTFATSQYDNYGFSSFFRYDGVNYGVAPDGIYELSGDTDAGAAISSLIDFGTSDCGVSGRKKILNVHVATTDGDGMYLKVDTDSGTYTFALEACRRGASGWRAKLPNNVQGTHWNWTLISTIDYELSGVEFTPARLSRRL